MQKRFIKAEYIWLDGAEGVQQLRSKSKIIIVDQASEVSIKSFDPWQFDGSSTFQATGHDSDLTLEPGFFIKDPLRSGESYL
ncbi:MAG TPA: glutamine synthetase, partial [Myxococcota bacterium]|nr:glutamine synthetase [Myxococcota bacterium]